MNDLETRAYEAMIAYSDGRPIMSDADFDAIIATIREQNPDNPILSMVGSPATYNQPVHHEIPMGSLNKCTFTYSPSGERSLDDLLKWFDSVLPASIVVTPKIDGMATELRYDHGILVQASSRGNGHDGLDLTDNVKHVVSIPKILRRPAPADELVLRGESYIPRAHFRRLVESGVVNDTNERNICAGALKTKNPVDIGKFGIKFICYRAWFDGAECESITSTADIFNKHQLIRDVQGNILYHVQPVKVTRDNLMQFIENAEKQLDSYPFLTDGLVFSVNDTVARLEHGVVNMRPKGSIAFKFAPEQKLTHIRDITWGVGRYLALTPVAVFDPVELSGATVDHATLHNAKTVIDNNLKIGDLIKTQRSGEVIPFYVKTIEQAPGKFTLPEFCPVCGFHTRLESVELLCTNRKCPAAVVANVKYWLDTVGVKGLGETVLQHLADRGLLTGILDLYRLQPDDFKNVPRVSSAGAQKLLAAIHAIDTVPVLTFLKGLPVQNVGGSTWSAIICHCGEQNVMTWLETVSVDELTSIRDVGPVTAAAIRDFFTREIDFVTELSGYVRPIQTKKVSGVLQNKSFCFTGSLEKPRGYYEKLVTDCGGTVSGSVTKTLDYLVAGENAGSKLEKAKSTGVAVITVDQFLSMTDQLL